MTNDEKINCVDDLKNKKTDKKSIAKIIFAIIILGLVIVWFTASFMRNINSTKNHDHIEERNINRLIDDLDVDVYNSTISIYNYYVQNLDYNSNGDDMEVNDYISVNLSYSYDLNTNSFVDSVIYIDLGFGLFEDSYFTSINLNLNYLNNQYYDMFALYVYQNYSIINYGDVYYSISSLAGNTSQVLDVDEFYFFSYSFIEETYINITFDFGDLYTEVSNVESIYQLGLDNSYDYGYEEGYDYGYHYGYTEGYNEGDDIGYDRGLIDGQKDNINQNAFKTLFNAILNAPYNIFSGLLEFEILGVNLFSLFSFIFTTILIVTLIKFFMK